VKHSVDEKPVVLSVVAPMYNEEDSVADTARRVAEALEGFEGRWELVMVNDGSTDGSLAAAQAEAQRDPRVRVVSYEPNAGRGRALRTGFAAARGEIVVSVDFDLSYEPGHIVRLHDRLKDDPSADVVLASAYMPGGTVEGVPWKRLFVSRMGNRVLRHAFAKPIATSTCIVRGYRRRVFEALELRSDGKEIHLEILRKALTLGFEVVEIPGHLRARQKGKSKARMGLTALSHLRFLVEQRPGLVFGTLGGGLLALAMVLGAGAAALAVAGRAAWRAAACAGGGLGLLSALMFACWFLARRDLELERELVALERTHRLLLAGDGRRRVEAKH